MAIPHLLLTCSICNKLISLEESKITEDGKPVHGECYYEKIKAVKDRQLEV